MTIPTKNLAISRRVYMLPADAVRFPFAWASRQSPSICPCQSLVTPNLAVIMGNTGAFTISWLWLVFSPRCSFPCFFDSAIRECHATPPYNSRDNDYSTTLSNVNTLLSNKRWWSRIRVWYRTLLCWRKHYESFTGWRCGQRASSWLCRFIWYIHRGFIGYLLFKLFCSRRTLKNPNIVYFLNNLLGSLRYRYCITTSKARHFFSKGRISSHDNHRGVKDSKREDSNRDNRIGQTKPVPPNKQQAKRGGGTMIYLFTYDLYPSSPRNVEPLKNELRKSTAWCNYLERTWLIGTYESYDRLNARLAVHLSANDYWLVVRITYEYTGWLPNEAWDWIVKTSEIMGI